MDMIEVQIKLGFASLYGFSIESVGNSDTSWLIGKAEKLSKIKASVLGLTLLIPDNKEITNPSNHTYIKSFLYDCNGCDNSEIESIIKGATHILIQNNLNANSKDLEIFNRDLYYAVKGGDIVMIYPPSEPAPLDTQW